MSRLKTLPPWLCSAIIAIAVFGAYANTFSAPFVLDSEPIATAYPFIRHLWPLSVSLSPPHDGSTVEGRPIVSLSLAVSYALSGTAPWGYHLLNLLIHVLAGLALFGIVRRTARLLKLDDTPANAFALTVALLWALHPLQTESVTYVIQRAESLMGLFYLLTLYFFIRATDSEGNTLSQPRDAGEGLGLKSPGDLRASAPLGGASGLGEHSSPETSAPNLRRSLHLLSLVFFTLSVAFCLLGMATKEVMVSAPLIVLLYDRTFLAGSFRSAWKTRWGYYLPLGFTWFLLAWLVAGSAGRNGTAGFSVGLPWSDYALTQVYGLVHYVRLALWPHPLIFDYGATVVRQFGLLAPSALLLLLALGATAAGLAANDRAARIVGLCGAWFFAILAPTSLVPIASESLAEHRMYLALVPIAVAAACALRSIGARRKNADLVLAAVAVVALAGTTFARNQVYASPLALWGDTVLHKPDNSRARTQYGRTLLDAGKLDEAAAQFKSALALEPAGDFYARYDLGNCLFQQGDMGGAALQFREAIRINPRSSEAHNNFANALVRLGRTSDALPEYAEALRLDPGNGVARDNYAVAIFNQGSRAAQDGRILEAVDRFEEALRIKPDYAEAEDNLGNALFFEGRYNEAAEHYARAIALKPDYARAHYNFASDLLRLDRYAEAVRHYQEALRIQPDYPEARAMLEHLKASGVAP